MKKYLLVAALVLAVVAADARDYKHSIGVNVGSLNGISYKGYVRSQEHFVFQFDANVQLGYASRGASWATDKDGKSSKVYDSDPFGFYAFVVNPNLMYQGDCGDWSWASMHWFIGGGIDLGLMWNQYTKIGSYNSNWLKVNEHVLTGVEFDLKAVPLNFGLDLRPGIGEAAYIFENGASTTMLFFDWGASLFLRYRI